MPLPQVSTAVGRQGQVPFTLPGWDLVLAVADEQPFGDQLSFIVDAVPNAGQTINIEAIETLRLLLLRILSFLTGSYVGAPPDGKFWLGGCQTELPSPSIFQVPGPGPCVDRLLHGVGLSRRAW